MESNLSPAPLHQVVGRCRDCVHLVGVRGSLGECKNDVFKYGYLIADDEVPADSALIEFDEGWGWRVGCDFGCVHFAPNAKDDRAAESAAPSQSTC